MEELFLTLLTFSKKLNIVDNKRIDSAKLALKAGQIPSLDCSDESVDELFTAQKLNYRLINFLPDLVTNSVQKVGLTKARTAVKKKGIVSIAQRMAHSNAARVAKTVARPHYEIIKRIIGMKFKPQHASVRATAGLGPGNNVEIHRYKMAGYSLSCLGEAVFAVVA